MIHTTSGAHGLIRDSPLPLPRISNYTQQLVYTSPQPTGSTSKQKPRDADLRFLASIHARPFLAARGRATGNVPAPYNGPARASRATNTGAGTDIGLRNQLLNWFENQHGMMLPGSSVSAYYTLINSLAATPRVGHTYHGLPLGLSVHSCLLVHPNNNPQGAI